MCSPHVRRLGQDAAVVSYVRLIQTLDPSGAPNTTRTEETRIWQRKTAPGAMCISIDPGHLARTTNGRHQNRCRPPCFR
jgi:hypothetical protein